MKDEMIEEIRPGLIWHECVSERISLDDVLVTRSAPHMRATKHAHLAANWKKACRVDFENMWEDRTIHALLTQAVNTAR